jgi:hypothetical protein
MEETAPCRHSAFAFGNGVEEALIAAPFLPGGVAEIRNFRERSKV